MAQALTILILGREDDCEAMRDILREQFSGLRIIAAHAHQDAVAQLDKIPVHIVLVARTAVFTPTWTADVRSWMARWPELASIPFIVPGADGYTLH